MALIRGNALRPPGSVAVWSSSALCAEARSVSYAGLETSLRAELFGAVLEYSSSRGPGVLGMDAWGLSDCCPCSLSQLG